VVDEIINLPTELQFSLLSEEGKVLEEELIPFHRKKRFCCKKRAVYEQSGLTSPFISYWESAVAESDPSKWRHYQDEIVLLCVRWYLRYALSYRDLEEMMQERSLSLDHTTIYRWVQAYAPELEKRIRPHLRLTDVSLR